PEAASIQGESDVVAGDDITLTCSTVDRGNPEGTYKWKKPNGGTQDGKNLNIENLNNIQRGKHGSYFCKASNEMHPSAHDNFNLIVNCSPALQMAFPDDRIHGVTEGASVYFFVEALSHPTPNFQWKRTFNNGTTVNLPSDDSGNKSNLTITNIEMEDFGNYTVSAHNNIGRWEDIKFELRALGRPFRVDDESFYLLVESTVKP
ncbi:hypothetical protein CAPTEDRAFT_124975, partial [Capitella teleta]